MSSEIARIRQQIELESAAMKLALFGFATAARHECISHKYDAIGKWQEKLRTLVGEEEATEITVQTYNDVMERDEEDMESFEGLMPAVPVRHLKTPPMIEAAKKAMREHGCVIVEDGEHCVVTFPEGTMRREVFPRLYNERYIITLPDGFQMREVYERCQEYSLLFLDASAKVV